MKRKSIALILVLFIIIVVPVVLAGLLPATYGEPSALPDMVDMDEISSEDILAERYWRMVDPNGREITITGRRIYVGDEYITGDNKLYRVYKVRGRTAYARFIREVGSLFETERQGLFASLTQKVRPVQNNQEEGDDLEPETEPQRLIGIYHTHNAESYVPTDGTDSIFGKGGIHQVGASFAASMEEKGVEVIYDETLHLPHDRGAYRRSRPTAERLLMEGPDVIFDIHRDATPRHVYATQIGEEWVTQVQLVVGRQNPNMSVNRQFALDLKNTADEVHPNLVKGIFMAHGHYNQDLTPMNLLLEVGAHTNSREAAEDGIALFTDVVAFYFYGPEDEREEAAPFQAQRPPGARTAPGIRAATRNIFMLLGVTGAIAVGFVLLNLGRVEDIKSAAALYLEKISRPLKRGDYFLGPLRQKLYNLFEPVRTFLAPWLERLRLFLRRVWLFFVPYLKRGDSFLLPWQEKIHSYATRVNRRLQPLLKRGDLFLDSLSEKIYIFAVNVRHYVIPRLRAADRYLSSTQERMFHWTRRIWGKIIPILERGDERLALWQEKIRDYALMLKDSLIKLYRSVFERRKVR
jgi:stage II sporulation protein P